MPVPCFLRFQSNVSYQGGQVNMARFLHHVLRSLQRKWEIVFLAFCFSMGLVFGTLSFYRADLSSSLMHGAISGSVSIVHLLSVILLPFLLSALAVFFSKPKLIFAIAFLKAFNFAFISAGVFAAFGCGGWLVRWLLMFSDCLTMPLLWLYWLRNAFGCRAFRIWEVGTTAAAYCLIGCLDYYFIMPLLLGI